MPKKRPAEYNNLQGHPPHIHLEGGRIAFFQFVCPITGDACYKGTSSDGYEYSAIHINPLAPDRQLAYFSR